MDRRYSFWCLMATWLTTVIGQSQVAAAGVRAMVVNHMGQLNNNPEENGENDWGEEEIGGAGMGTRRFGGDMKSDVFEQGETRDFLQFLRRIKYDHRQRPEDDYGGPVAVNVSIYVSSIRSVSEITMDYALELFFRESWIDPRLDWDPSVFKNKSELALHESYTNFLWHPDTFMPNAIDSKNPMKQSITHRSLLRLKEKGFVLYSRRLSVTAECPMDLTMFPFDTQLCKLAIESYGYTADQVIYFWSGGGGGGSDYLALKLKEIRLPDFKLIEAYVTSETESYATGVYSRLYVCFAFSRSAGFCFLQLIIPSTAVVITSWVSLWMENETSFQDMISIILTITFLIFSYNAVMPRVSYIKAMDVYLGVCFFIVFFSLIKLALIKYMRQRLRMTRDTSIVAGMMPMIQIGTIANGTPPQLDGGNSLTLPDSNHIVNNRRSVRLFGHRYRVSRWGHYCSQIEFTPRFIQRFHWISQMIFFFGFVFFCLLYFLIYPNIHHTVQFDSVCDRSRAIWFAEIKK